jgi:hypothetical protein
LPGLHGPWSFFIGFPHNWDDRHTTPYPACLLRWGLNNFLPGPALNYDPPNLYLPSSWDLGLEAWLKWYIACLASMKPWVKIWYCQRGKKKKRIARITGMSHHVQWKILSTLLGVVPKCQSGRQEEHVLRLWVPLKILGVPDTSEQKAGIASLQNNYASQIFTLFYNNGIFLTG